jgi:hypothetical protein
VLGFTLTKVGLEIHTWRSCPLPRRLRRIDLFQNAAKFPFSRKPRGQFDHFYGIELEREIVVDSAELLKTVVAEIDRGSLTQNGTAGFGGSRRNDGRILEQAGRIFGLRRERRKPAALPTRTAFRPQSQSGSSRPSSASHPRLSAEMGGEQLPRVPLGIASQRK